MRATGIAATTAFCAPALAACQADGSEQDRVASAFVSAAIRLGRELPAESAEHADPTERAERAPYPGPSRAPYIGRHRRGITVRLGAERQAAQP